MRAKGYNFGGEQSGHLVFLDHNTTGDGILAGLQLLAIMIRKNKTALRTRQDHVELPPGLKECAHAST